MTTDKLPLYVNIFPDGRGTLTCAHCAIDAELEGAHATALFTRRRGDGPGESSAIVWQSDLSAEQLIAATRDQCQHMADYGPG